MIYVRCLAGKGLDNPKGEYNCFLNVIIQSLWQLEGFRDALTEVAELRPQSTSGQDSLALLKSLAHVFQLLSGTPGYFKQTSHSAISCTLAWSWRYWRWCVGPQSHKSYGGGMGFWGDGGAEFVCGGSCAVSCSFELHFFRARPIPSRSSPRSLPTTQTPSSLLSLSIPPAPPLEHRCNLLSQAHHLQCFPLSNLSPPVR